MLNPLPSILATLSIAALGVFFQPLQEKGTAEQDATAEETGAGESIFGAHDGSIEKIVERLQGAWQLLHIEDPELPPEGRSHHGVMMISGNFLAIEVHVAWDDEDGFAIEDAFQSGINEFAIDSAGKLHTISLIGSYLDEDEVLDWEEPGLLREFTMKLERNLLSLTRADGSTLDFGRRLPRTGLSRDIFGRVSTSAKGMGDIYGRESAPEPASEDGR